jgi:hypothetical protein
MPCDRWGRWLVPKCPVSGISEVGHDGSSPAMPSRRHGHETSATFADITCIMHSKSTHELDLILRPARQAVRCKTETLTVSWAAMRARDHE